MFYQIYQYRLVFWWLIGTVFGKQTEIMAVKRTVRVDSLTQVGFVAGFVAPGKYLPEHAPGGVFARRSSQGEREVVSSDAAHGCPAMPDFEKLSPNSNL